MLNTRTTLTLLTALAPCAALAQSAGGGVVIIPRDAPPPQAAASGALAKFEPSGDRVYHGAGLKGTWDIAQLRQQSQDFQRTAGKKLAVVTWFASTYENSRLTSWRSNYGGQLNRVKQLGAISLIKFSVQDSNFDATRKIADLKHIALGVYDPYFEEMGETLRDFGGPVFLSINHEMNGTWYPFSEAYPRSGVTAADFVSAFRHIVGILKRKGADNVALVWSPNVPDVGPVGFAKYYPGDDVVDWIGVSFYSGNPVDNMEMIYRAYSAKKPFFITEWATSIEKNKYNTMFTGEGAWVRDVLAALQKKYPRVKGISWFQWQKEDGNHLLQRVPDQVLAYSTGVANPRYIDDAGPLLAMGPNKPGGIAPIPREIVLNEAKPAEIIKTEVIKTETPARAPLKLSIFKEGVTKLVEQLR